LNLDRTRRRLRSPARALTAAAPAAALLSLLAPLFFELQTAAAAAAAPSDPGPPTWSGDPARGFRVVVPIGAAAVLRGDVDGVPIDEVVLPRGLDLAPPGTPQLPARIVMIRVPWGVEPRVRATPAFVRQLGAIRPAPYAKLVTGGADAKPPGRDLRDTMARPAYASAEAPELLRRVVDAAAGGERILAVELSPVQWDPRTGAAWQFEEIQIDVSWEGVARSLPGGEGRSAAAASASLSPEDAVGPAYPDDAASRGAARRARGGRLAPLGSAAGAAIGPFRIEPTRPWVRLGTRRAALYRVTAQDLVSAGVAVGSIDPATFRLFRSHPSDLPESVDVDLGPDSLREVAIEVLGDGDALFESTDTLTFFGTGAFGYGYDLRAGGGTEFQETSRTFEAPYWLTWGPGPIAAPPRRVGSRDVSLSGAAITPFTQSTHRVHFGQNRFGDEHLAFPGFTWDRWFDRAVVQGSRFAYAFTLPQAVPGGAGSTVVRLWGSNSSIGTSIPDHVATVKWNRALVDSAGWDFSTPRDLRGDGLAVGLFLRDTLEVEVPVLIDPFDANRQDRQMITWFDVAYSRFLLASNDTLLFTARDSLAAGSYRYAISGIGDSAGVALYDRTDPEGLVRLTGGTWSGTPGAFTLTAEVAVAAGEPLARYALLSRRQAIRPATVALFSPPVGPRTVANLLDPANAADYIVVAPAAFHAAAESLAADRSAFLHGVASPVATVATLDRVFAQFSGGIPDAAAIRNFLAYAARYWARAPLYVCLLGDASLDPLNFSGLGASDLVPTYAGGFHTGLQEQFSLDDWLVRLDGPSDPLLDLAVGRLPARTPQEALEFVRGKRRGFERTAAFDLARNRVLLSADDSWKWDQALQRDLIGLEHVRFMERKDKAHLPYAVTRSKVYLNDYAFSDSGKTSKPAAREAFIAGVNAGNWLVDFIGHGNNSRVADEALFLLSDVPRVGSAVLPGIWAFMSCTVGRFDDYRPPESMAEQLLRTPAGGAVAALAATGKVFGIESSELNDAFVDEIFPLAPRVDSLRTAGLAWARAKNRGANFSVRKYNLLGEPGLLPPIPRGRGAWVKAPADSALRGDLVTIDGRALNGDGSPDSLSSGLVRVRVQGPPSRRVETGFQNGNPGVAPYDLAGPTFYEGDVPLVNGAFTARFTVPVDARVSGPGARLEALLESAGGRGVGLAVDSLRIGAGLSTRIDVTPPAITLLAPPDTTFAPGSRLTFALEDSSGIDLTRFDNAHSIFVLFDDAGLPTELTAGFRYETGSATRGTVDLALPPLAPGAHRLEVHASDNYRNIGVATFTIDVAPAGAAGGALDLSQVFNYPNPFANETYLHVRLNQPARLRVKVLTVAGRRVREWSADGHAGGNYIPWDGRDSQGENVAIGVYLIHVTAEAPGGGSVSAVARSLRTR
jgi:hypothetical protein